MTKSKSTTDLLSSDKDKIDEASAESFPASDAPAWFVPEPPSVLTQPITNKVSVYWQRNTLQFSSEHYNPEAELVLRNDYRIKISSRCFDAQYYQPEELFIAALASSYLQAFLAVALKQGYNIAYCVLQAQSLLKEKEPGVAKITEIALDFEVSFEGIQPLKTILHKMQEEARAHCILIHSISSPLSIQLKAKDIK